MGCPKCGCRMVARSPTLKNTLICCDCGCPAHLKSKQAGIPINWWLLTLIIGSLIGTLGLFIAYDQMSSAQNPEVAPTESAEKLHHSHFE